MAEVKSRSVGLWLRPIACLILLIGICSTSFGHTNPYEMEKLGKGGVALLYLKIGFEHILPLGLDHILFVAGLFLLNPKLKWVVTQASVFTVAHSITLGLAITGYINPPGDVVEPIIALSILFIAIENILASTVSPWRLLIVFAFGLVHGMGFAGALSELGLPETDFITTLIMFNVGVELGQITVIMILYLLLALPFSKKPWYRQRIVWPLSAVIAMVALYWTVERTFS